VWLIWTKDKTDDLESARTSAFDGQCTVKDKKNVGKINGFVQKYEKAEASKNGANQQILVKDKGETVVYRKRKLVQSNPSRPEIMVKLIYDI